MSLLLKILPHKVAERIWPDPVLEKKYVAAGAEFGDAVSYIYMGECVGFEGMLNTWDVWEREYARRGYRTVSLDAFVELGGYNTPLGDAIGKRREAGEEPIYHAQIYRKQYLGKIEPAVDLEKMMREGGTQAGVYLVPSTEIEKLDNEK
ncbi:MAG: hypothetical protein HGA85_03855 [Nanoarchaeota archaeon]|nr:hypothetical protein [Nanoarchaeota archaeon]